ncbi:Uncharacterized protein APZ42_022443 [Daphnia magna]|uniref:Uncharacterized protein n=1 Tax=Daphnia magna TaxID=35525 RepID=A0A164VHT1_9CRUS|nr:Uncharacterized protein APZ42_022443 [Daphnia magna]
MTTCQTFPSKLENLNSYYSDPVKSNFINQNHFKLDWNWNFFRTTTTKNVGKCH